MKALLRLAQGCTLGPPRYIHVCTDRFILPTGREREREEAELKDLQAELIHIYTASTINIHILTASTLPASF